MTGIATQTNLLDHEVPRRAYRKSRRTIIHPVASFLRSEVPSNRSVGVNGDGITIQ